MGGAVVKLMSLSAEEFRRSLAVLAAEATRGADGRYEILVADGSVSVGFEELPAAILGGSLALPRARVTLTFDGLTGEAEAAFLARFDRTFQRGGG